MKKYEAIKSFEENDEDLEMGHENQIHDSATKIINNEERSTMISSSSSSSRKQEQQQHQQQPQTSQRLLSLDVFRGLTVAVFSLYLPYFALF
ncbi:transmembrane protein, putative [Medicago truncatula]|uniref:Transmembrane protein, putative n=1 Tax=Medicago truncatula TaxID=3880 RepID=A0A072TXA4_MEDTR|nr:transmembrane protein, putative [Medicago truncatula]